MASFTRLSAVANYPETTRAASSDSLFAVRFWLCSSDRVDRSWSRRPHGTRRLLALHHIHGFDERIDEIVLARAPRDALVRVFRVGEREVAEIGAGRIHVAHAVLLQPIGRREVVGLGRVDRDARPGQQGTDGRGIPGPRRLDEGRAIAGERPKGDTSIYTSETLGRVSKVLA